MDDTRPALDLRAFAEATAAGLPGWRAVVRDLPLRDDQRELVERLWDEGARTWLLSEGTIRRAAVLVGPGNEEFLVCHQPETPDRFLLGALRPAEFSARLIHSATTVVLGPPLSVGNEPSQAAAQIQHRLLPDLHRAIWRVRIHAVAGAIKGINRAGDAWDAVSDSFCDEDGHVLDELGYSEGKARRDAESWWQFQAFLDHGPALVEGLSEHALHAELSWPTSPGGSPPELWRLRMAHEWLAAGTRLRQEWQQAEATLPAPALVPARDLRNAEGWHYASEFADYGSPLVSHARKMITQAPGEPDKEAAERINAALKRSAPGLRAPAPARPGNAATTTPSLLRRTR